MDRHEQATSHKKYGKLQVREANIRTDDEITMFVSKECLDCKKEAKAQQAKATD